VGRVFDHGLFPRSTSSGVGTLRVGDHGSNPVTILLIIPVLGLLSLWVRDHGWLILEPVGRLLSILVDNLIRLLLVPVLGLDRLGIGHLGGVDPVRRLGVGWVVNLCIRVDGRGEALQESSIARRNTVDHHLECLVRPDDEGVERCGGSAANDRSVLHVLLLVLSGDRVLVLEDEVHLVGGTALIRTEHDDIGRSVGELVRLES